MPTKGVFALALSCALACGGKSNGRIEQLHEETGVDSKPPQGWNRQAQLRLLGVNADAFAAAQLSVAHVEVRAHGKPLDTTGLQTHVDLANMQHAWLMGRFTVPEDATELEVRVRFAAEGMARRADFAGRIAADCTEIVATVLVEPLKLRSHAVLHVDVDRSLRVKTGQGLVFLPDVQVVY